MSKQQTIVKTYKGNQEQATSAFRTDAEKMAIKGYFPTSQVWAPGSYGCGSFVVALLLCFILIGLLIFVYMLIVKPAGTLTVTYALAPPMEAEKICPQCAERVKAAATLCRFCGYTFENVPVANTEVAESASQPSHLSGAEAFGRKLGRMVGRKL